MSIEIPVIVGLVVAILLLLGFFLKEFLLCILALCCVTVVVMTANKHLDRVINGEQEQNAPLSGGRQIALTVKKCVNSTINVLRAPIGRACNFVAATQTGRWCYNTGQRYYQIWEYLSSRVRRYLPGSSAEQRPRSEQAERADVAEGIGRLGADVVESFVRNVQQEPHIQELKENLNEMLGKVFEKTEEKVAQEKVEVIKGEFKGAIFWGTTILVGAVGAWFLLKHFLTKPNQDQTKPHTRVPEFEKRLIIDRLRSLYTKTSPFSSEMIFEPRQQERLNAVKELIVSLSKKKCMGVTQDSYPRLLLYGPHGTGKRSFAQSIAQATGMSFVPVVASVFFTFKGSDAFKAVDTFFDEIKQNARGTVLFIKQAELLLSQPKDEHPLDERAVFIAYLAEHINSISALCPVLFSLEELPTALHKTLSNCITHQILFTLPAFEERTKLLKLFSTRLCAQEKEPYTSLMSDQELQTLAKDLEGASCADLQKVLVNIQ